MIGVLFALIMIALAFYLTGREISRRVSLEDTSTTPGAMPGAEQKGSR